MEYSGKGPSGVWILTARPLKQGISNTNVESSFNLLRWSGLKAKGALCVWGRSRDEAQRAARDVRGEMTFNFLLIITPSQ